MRPGRPFGLTLAILMTVVLFSLVPLAIALITWRVNTHFTQSISEEFDQEIQGISSGPLQSGLIQPLTINPVLLMLQLAFLVVAVIAWIGRPSWMRWTFQAFVLFFALLNTAQSLRVPAPTSNTGFDSGQGVETTLLQIQLCLTALITAYTLWYVNRAPARAFYRGYYLPAPEVSQSEGHN